MWSCEVGCAIGVVLAAAYLFQTAGLLFTTPTNTGFITGLFVVFAPLADRLLFGTELSREVIVATVLSLVGMALLAGGGPAGPNWGDFLTLLCAVALGLHIALLSRYASSYGAGALTLAQILTVALIFVVLWPFFDAVSLPPPGVWVALITTGLVASALAYLAQTTAQQHIPAARTAIILTMEPVFAAIFGYWLAGDRLVAPPDLRRSPHPFCPGDRGGATPPRAPRRFAAGLGSSGVSHSPTRLPRTP
jgi:drug/metabolite transporter (DMT)-like permease